MSLPSLSLQLNVWSEEGERLTVFPKFCLKHKEGLARNKVEGINRKMALKRESFAGHPEHDRDPLKTLKPGGDIVADVVVEKQSPRKCLGFWLRTDGMVALTYFAEWETTGGGSLSLTCMWDV